MESSSLFLLGRSLALGFALAASPGPMGLLCVRRTLASGPAAGLASGLGVAAGDAICATVGVVGLTAVTAVVSGAEAWLRLAGGALLVWMGVRAFIAPPAPAGGGRSGKGELAGAFGSMVALTLTNPATLLGFVVLLAGLGLRGAASTWLQALLVVCGVAAGSLAWWIALTALVSRLRRRLDLRWLGRINRVSGAALVVFGLLALPR